jgi:hypothetical protein
MTMMPLRAYECVLLSYRVYSAPVPLTRRLLFDPGCGSAGTFIGILFIQPHLLDHHA